jgi:hypothetical protein
MPTMIVSTLEPPYENSGSAVYVHHANYGDLSALFTRDQAAL